MTKKIITSLAITTLLLQNSIMAAPLNLSKDPLILLRAIAPLTMLVMGRDHKLYYEAYNDASDITGDGVIDTNFRSDIIYFGYFDSFKCYQHNGSEFYPTSKTKNWESGNTTCSGAWSGNWLNYVTTSRIDALRKVLYGGKRAVDSSTSTVLARAYIPQDAHSWGKSYTSPSVDGYNLSDYTPYGTPSPGNRHLFANTTRLHAKAQGPLLRVAVNVPYKIWEWVSIERPVVDNQVATGNNSRKYIGDKITDYRVHVKVCDSNFPEKNCVPYGQDGNIVYKPTGLLQDFGENDSMKFGLITSSYIRNLSGGVLRKNIGSIKDEINASTGQFTSVNGIISTLDRLSVIDFASSHYYNKNCGWIFDRPLNDGECSMWGNPVAEMLYEAMRYFAGKSSPTTAFSNFNKNENPLGLAKPAWTNPYSNEPYCAKPNILLISDLYPSYDSDQVPGSAFSSFSGDLGNMNVQSLGQTIWNTEKGGSSRHFIGQSLSDAGSNNSANFMPTAKDITSFGNIRGLMPEEPTKLGSYYSASVAYYGWLNDINSIQGNQKVKTYVVALASPTLNINIPVGGSNITIVPFGKSVGGCNVNSQVFAPTNTIVDVFVESISPTGGTFLVNFEDVEQGADHDMDAIVRYQYVINPNNTVTVTLDSDYAAGCVIQHLGFSISGTTEDGVYLGVRDSDTAAQNDVSYILDDPNDGNPLPLHYERTFSPGSSNSSLLKSPLWYAAKWGSFDDINGNNVPDLAEEFDKDGDGVPDNYFLVTNALNLKNQLTRALEGISKRSSAQTRVSANSGRLSNKTLVYQTLFESKDWYGQMLAYKVDANTGKVLRNGPAHDGAQWDAASKLDSQNWQFGRRVLSYRTDTDLGIPFSWSQLSTSQQDSLRKSPITGNMDTTLTGVSRWAYLRGHRGDEKQHGGVMRNRVHVLGDLVNSAPQFVGAPAFRYHTGWPNTAAEKNSNYSSFKSLYHNRREMIYIGANDGMLHAIDANTGAEMFSYVPSQVYQNLSKLTSPDYTHQPYVDASANFGDVYINGVWKTVLIGGLGLGGRGIYALDITDPDTITEGNADQKVLWEFNYDKKNKKDKLIAKDLGYTYGKVAIVRMANNKWAAIFGNGYNNTTGSPKSGSGDAVLYIVNIQNGNLIKKISTKVGLAEDPKQTSRPNGLATPAVVDSNGDNIADYIYAGDLFGNLWKFDVTDPKPSNWKVSLGGKPLFVAEVDAANNTKERQPITTRPTVTRVPNKNGTVQVLFGTGKLLESSDKSNTNLQSFYAIQDQPGGNSTVLRGQLLQQSYTGELQLTDTLGKTTYYRSTSKNILLPSHKGWYIDLAVNGATVGERVISSPIARFDKIIFPTMTPSNDTCTSGGIGWLVELNAFTGARFEYAPFDLDGDRHFTYKDKELQDLHKISAKKSEVGVIGTPGIISDGTREFKYSSGSSGGLQSTVENPGVIKEGRQSWQQIK